MSRRLLPMTLLVVLSVGVLRAQGLDSLFHVVDSLYGAGAYSRAELEARRLLETRMLSDSTALAAEQWVAFALVAQGEPALAREHFLKILQKRPQYQLDPTLTSPKIVAVLNEARSASSAGGLRPEGPPGLPVRKPPGGITFRTILFPGWEQLYQRRTTAGAVFLGAGVATLGAGILFDFSRRTARDEYLAATSPEEIETKYQAYNRAAQREAWAFASFAAVYLLSEIDVFLNDSPVAVSFKEAGAGTPALSLTWTFP